jgi:hypothetical protein
VKSERVVASMKKMRIRDLTSQETVGRHPPLEGRGALYGGGCKLLWLGLFDAFTDK